ncbi:MAG: rRNA maturation RNase YbeY [Candidatus Pacebacteria bacterium]|nr:rRNA maturation RNase YbeY [Candidatus Paceibacterota bacterium]MDD3808084.1 rRNA maturation RNase YbeY [Candidatus Paceibacterota bacterium]
MEFECFVFDEVLISDKEKKIIDDLVQEIFESQTFLKILKDKKIKNISFSLILIDNDEAKKLNKDFRNKDKIPDVLSFPFNEKEGNTTILGDIFITPKELKKKYTLRDGYLKLLIHGLLHLLGYDHIQDKDFAKMEKLETIIAKELNN